MLSYIWSGIWSGVVLMVDYGMSGFWKLQHLLTAGHSTLSSLYFGSTFLSVLRCSFAFCSAAACARSVILFYESWNLLRESEKEGKLEHICREIKISVIRRASETVLHLTAFAAILSQIILYSAHNQSVLDVLFQYIKPNSDPFFFSQLSPEKAMVSTYFVLMAAYLVRLGWLPISCKVIGFGMTLTSCAISSVSHVFRTLSRFLPFSTTTSSSDTDSNSSNNTNSITDKSKQSSKLKQNLAITVAQERNPSEKYDQNALKYSHSSSKKLYCAFHCGTELFVIPPTGSKKEPFIPSDPSSIAVFIHDHAPVCSSCMNGWMATCFKDRLSGVYNILPQVSSSPNSSSSSSSSSKSLAVSFSLKKTPPNNNYWQKHKPASKNLICVFHDCNLELETDDFKQPGIESQSLALFERLQLNDQSVIFCPQSIEKSTADSTTEQKEEVKVGCGRKLFINNDYRPFSTTALDQNKRIALATNNKSIVSIRQVQCSYSDCKHMFCRACLKSWSSHDPKNGYLCAGEQKIPPAVAKAQFESAVQTMFSKGIRACPACLILIERTTGCDHMTHLGCPLINNYQFCYVCNNPYTGHVCKVNLSYLRAAILNSNLSWAVALESEVTNSTFSSSSSSKSKSKASTTIVKKTYSEYALNALTRVLERVSQGLALFLFGGKFHFALLRSNYNTSIELVPKGQSLLWRINRVFSNTIYGCLALYPLLLASPMTLAMGRKYEISVMFAHWLCTGVLSWFFNTNIFIFGLILFPHQYTMISTSLDLSCFWP